MKKLLILAVVATTLISSCTQPQYVQPMPMAQQQEYIQQPQQVYVPQQNYQVIVDPVSGTQNVVYSMNGIQYVIAYAMFMNWYHMGGYGYVNRMYGSNRSYFNSYQPSRYRSWKSSSFRDTYQPRSSNYQRSGSTITNYQRPSNTTTTAPAATVRTGSSFGTRTTTSSSTPSSFRSSSSTYSAPRSSSSSSSSSRTSSFGRRH